MSAWTVRPWTVAVLVVVALVAGALERAMSSRRRAVVRARCEPAGTPVASSAPPRPRRRRTGAPSASPGVWSTAARSVATSIGSWLRRVAGRPPDADADVRLGRAVLLGTAAWVAARSPVVAVGAGIVTWSVPVVRAASRRARRRRQVLDEAPEVVDLVRLGIGSGLNVRLAIEAVTRHHRGLLTGELVAVLDRTGRGERLADALDATPLGRDDAVRPLVDALVAAERYGAPLAAALDRVADDARTTRRRQREEAARRVPVKLLFPLVFCTLPAFALLTVVPVLLRSLPSLAP